MDGRTCEDGRFDVGDQWYTGFDGTPTHFEAIGHSIGVHGIWHIDHHVHLAGLQEGEHVWLLYHISTLAERHETNQKTKETCRMHFFDRRLVDQAARHSMLRQVVRGALGCKQAEAHLLMALHMTSIVKSTSSQPLLDFQQKVHGFTRDVGMHRLSSTGVEGDRLS